MFISKIKHIHSYPTILYVIDISHHLYPWIVSHLDSWLFHSTTTEREGSAKEWLFIFLHYY